MPVRDPTTANDRCLRRQLRTDIPRTELKYHHRRGYVRTLLVNVRHRDRAAIGGNFQITHDILLYRLRADCLGATCVLYDQGLGWPAAYHHRFAWRRVSA